MSVQQKRTDLATRLGRVIIFCVLVVVAAAFLVAHVLAWRWASEQPFLGMLLEPTLVLSPLRGSGWARLQFDPPLEQPDRLIGIDGQPVERYADVATILSKHPVGDTVWVLLARPDGELREEQIILTPFPLKDLFLILVVPYLVGLAYLGIGVWVYWVQGWGRAGLVFTGLCAAFALTLGGLFDISTTHRLAILWSAAVPFAAAAAMHLALVFPQEPRFVRRVPLLRLLPYLPATFLAFRSAFSVYDVSQPWEYINHWRNSYLFAAVGIFFLLGLLVYRLVRPPSPLIRQQSRIILLGAALAFLPVVPWLLLNVLGHPVPFLTPFYAPLFTLFPLSIAYAILRYRLLDVDRLLSRGLVYGALTLLIVAAYFALINGLSHFLAVKASDPILLSLFVLALILLFNPLRNRAQRLVDGVFFREPVDYRAVRQEITSFHADIRGFTAFSERISPELQIEVLNRHLTLAAGAILAQEGTLDKFVGDSAMAIFNAPEPQKDHTLRAVRAALAMQQSIRKHHAQVEEQERLHFGIGIAVGEAVVGNIGSAVVQNFTAIGDCVNLSCRLSDLARPGQILISAEAYERVKDHVEANFIGRVQIRDHTQPDQVYEVVGLMPVDW